MLGEIQQRVLEQVDWKPENSSDFLLVLTRFINRAYQALFMDAPFLLEQEVSFITQPDVVSVTSVAQDRVSVDSTSRRTMKRLRTGLSSAAAAWDFNGHFDGRWVEIVDSVGQKHRRKTREFWQASEGAQGPITDYDYFSIEEPWPNNTDSNMAYRIYTPEYHLPPDTVSIKNARIWDQTSQPLVVKSQSEIEMAGLVDYGGRAVGPPSIIFKGKPYQLQAPTVSPLVELSQQSWVGPDNAGKFDLCMTYCWGNLDTDLYTPHGLRECRWESAPSPISDVIDTTNNGYAIKVVLPDVDWLMKFNISGAIDATRSGLRKRLYLRRYTADQGGGISRAVESAQVFMLLAEVNGHVQEYTYDGSVIADPLRRLKPIHGYQSVRLHPLPDARYTVDCRVQFRPAPLVNEADAPRLNDDGVDALVLKALHFLYQHDGKPELAMQAEGQYQMMLRTLTKRYATIDYAMIRKRPARVGRSAVLRSKNATWDGIS